MRRSARLRDAGLNSQPTHSVGSWCRLGMKSSHSLAALILVTGQFGNGKKKKKLGKSMISTALWIMHAKNLDLLNVLIPMDNSKAVGGGHVPPRRSSASFPAAILLGRGTWPPNTLQDWALQKTPTLLARQGAEQLIPTVQRVPRPPWSHHCIFVI